ncbi:MAG: hypothetical protein EP323_00985, partial [Gammaproteobacteria bacterium]
MKRLLKQVLWLWLAGASLPGLGDETCLLLAETYYEQIYCELKALGQGNKLPAFYDFRRNDELTQALLLKRPTAKLGIELAMPVRTKASVAVLPKSPAQSGSSSPDSVCRLDGPSLYCGDSHYRLVGNKGNGKLREGVLGSGNRMEIPVQRNALTEQKKLEY